MTQPIDFVWEHMRERAERVIDLSLLDSPLSFYEYINELVTDVVSAYPGSGKTRAASRLANQLWRDWELSTLHLMLSHPIIDERLRRMSETGEDVDWAHWRRHDKNCERRRFNTLGYVGYGECRCDRGPRNASSPTLAPVEYALPARPDSGTPLAPAANDFFLWIIDEIDFRRLLGNLTVTKKDVQRVSETHPEESIRVLCEVLASLMTRTRGRLNGAELYHAFTNALMEKGPEYSDFLQRLRETNPTMQPWSNLEEGTPPTNFPPSLLPIFLDELRSWRRSWPFTPRIHLVGTGTTAELRIWWRKELNYQLEEAPMPPPAFILDATAESSLLDLVFDISTGVRHLNRGQRRNTPVAP